MNGVQAEQVVFWSGAGISADLPTGGPLGRTLTDRALDTYTGEQVKPLLDALYEDLEAPNSAQRPRLETVLEAIVQVYGTDVLDEVLSDLVEAVPNRHHETFANHVLAGGRHVTANFDTCIERAIPGIPRSAVIHIHGSLMDDAATLGARLSVIQGGFSEVLRECLDQVFGDRKLTTLVFVGYSGSDFFDATPYLSEMIPGRSDLRVLWLDFKDQHLATVSVDSVGAPLLRQLALNGIDVECVQGRLDDFLGVLLPDLCGHGDPDGARRTWVPEREPTAEQRAAAALRLYVQIGYRKEVLRSLSEQLPKSPPEWEWLAQAQWSAGRYRSALDSWRRAFDGGGQEDRARLAEREAATLWIRGSLIRAERACWLAIGQWCTPDSPVTVEAQSRLLELYGRITTHMSRWPDIRLFVNRGRVETAAERLAHLEGAIGRGDLQARIVTHNALVAMRGEPDIELRSHIETFQESESLVAWLNYLHAEIRQRTERPSRTDLIAMSERFERVGAHGDAPRTLLLPGADAYFSGWDVFRAFSGVDVTAVQLLRFAAGVQARRVLRRFRQARG